MTRMSVLKWLGAEAALIALGPGLFIAAPAHAQLVATLVNRDGASFPGVTVGPLGSGRALSSVDGPCAARVKLG